MSKKKLISIVIPVYNEQENIPVVYEVVVKELSLLKSYDYELIFVDDGSADRSWEVLKTIIACDEHVKARSFTRNFGHQCALMAGYDIARGDAIITMDADMQHPPQLIADMIAQWENGFDIVYARKVNRKDNILKRFTAAAFYKIIDWASSVKMPFNVSDFRLIDKRVLQALLQCKEQAPYLRGLVSWLGFKHAYIECQYYKRFAGKTSYTWKKMFSLAFDGLTSFSTFPLKIAGSLGLLVTVAALFSGFYMFFRTFVGGVHFTLATWLAQGVFVIAGLQFYVIWLLGEYVGRIHIQQKKRPLYVIAEEAKNKRLAKTTGIVLEKKDKEDVFGTTKIKSAD